MYANKSEIAQESKQGWWKFPMMWLVVGGPAVVVVASMLTLTLAIHYPDPVLEHHDQASGATIQKHASPMMPAMTARNHAATSGK